MSGEAFEIYARPMFAWDLRTVADELRTTTEHIGDDRLTIAEALSRYGYGRLAKRHEDLVAELSQMAEVYRSLSWHLAGDTSEATMRAELDAANVI